MSQFKHISHRLLHSRRFLYRQWSKYQAAHELAPIWQFDIANKLLRPTRLIVKNMFDTAQNVQNKINAYELVKQFCVCQAVEALVKAVHKQITLASVRQPDVTSFVDINLLSEYKHSLELVIGSFGVSIQNGRKISSFYFKSFLKKK